MEDTSGDRLVQFLKDLFQEGGRLFLLFVLDKTFKLSGKGFEFSKNARIPQAPLSVASHPF